MEAKNSINVKQETLKSYLKFFMLWDKKVSHVLNDDSDDLTFEILDKKFTNYLDGLKEKLYIDLKKERRYLILLGKTKIKKHNVYNDLLDIIILYALTTNGLYFKTMEFNDKCLNDFKNDFVNSIWDFITKKLNKNELN